MFKIWVCCLIICLFPLAFAHADNNLDLQSLEKLIAEKQYSDALIKIQELRQNPNYNNSPELIYNLGLSEWFLEQHGPALAHFRLTNYLRPYTLKNLTTLRWAQDEIENIQHITLRKDPLLATLSLYLWPQYFFALSFLLLPYMAFVASRNKSAPLAPRLLKTLPWAGLSALLFVFFLIGQGQTHRVFATLVSLDAITAYAGPSDQSVDVGQLFPGDSVEVLRRDEAWWQIRTSDIPSAWVQANNLKVHSRLD